MNLQEYFKAHASLPHTIVPTVAADGRVTVTIHPAGVPGHSLTFGVEGNQLISVSEVPPQFEKAETDSHAGGFHGEHGNEEL